MDSDEKMENEEIVERIKNMFCVVFCQVPNEYNGFYIPLRSLK